MKHKYKYLYKIILTEGSLKNSYYFGQHKTNYLNDGYKGSGTIIKKYYKKYPNGYIKEILSFYSTQEELDKAEYEIVNKHLNDKLCINISFGGKSGGGHPQTEETKKKISNTCSGRKPNNYGYKWTEEQRKRHSEKMKGHTAWNKGKKMSEEQKKRISESNKGRKFSEEHRKKLGELHKGKPLSEEHKKHLSEALKGRVSPNKGKKFSEEYKKKLSEAHKGQTSGMKGKKMSEEQKQKLKEAWIRRKNKINYNYEGIR